MSGAVFLQLPVPETVPRQLCGNLPLGAADLILFARHAGIDLPMLIAPPEVRNRFGDAALVDWICGQNPEILCLTLTVWNVERSMDLALRARQRLPGLQIWVGGPEVAPGSVLFARPEAFDLAVMGEGEHAFAALLAGARPEEVPGVVVSGQRPGRVNAQPLENLDTVHDPFICGLVQAEADSIVFAEFWRGCRHRCLFCRYNQGRQGIPAGRSLPLVRDLMKWAADSGARELYLLDPSMEQRPDLHKLLETMHRATGGELPVFAELRADAVDPKLAKALAKAGVKRVETGLQTVTCEALRLAGRSLDVQSFRNGARALMENGIGVKTDVMLGLPGDSPQTFLATMEFLQQLDLHQNIQSFVTQVLPGTGLRRAARRLGVVYDAAPPYLVRSTPTWSADDLTRAQGNVEAASGVTMAGLEASVFVRPDLTGQASSEAPYPDSAAVLQYSFDVSKKPGLEALARQDFRQAGRSLVLYVRFEDDFLPGLKQVPEAISRCLAENPHSAATVVVECPPGFPLDPLDAILAALHSQAPSLYLDRMLGQVQPHRRLLAAFPARLAGRLVGSAWFEELATLAEPVWLAALDDVLAGTIPDAARRGDYLHVALTEPLPVTPEQLFSALRTSHQDPELLLVGDPVLQWAWARHADEAEGADW